MIRPLALKSGDKVGIVATGKKVFAVDLASAIAMIGSWGLHVELGTHLFSDEHPYLAASDEHRRANLQGMINDPAIKAIICARGGYGTTRILDDIDFDPLIKQPKWVVGFSDVTALHLKLFTMSIVSIHGTMPLLFANSDASSSVESLRIALFGKPEVIKAEPSVDNREGQATGMVVGGNLSLLVDALGTASEPELDGCILILEEVDEHLYRIDRMFTHLQRAGKLNNLAALIIGHITDLKDTTPGFGESINDIVLKKMQNSSFPIAFNFPSGHENPNLAWQHGSRMKIAVTQSETLLTPVD
ncbi:MAG: LD-carboxypeptidase [Chryseolinea sp.]